MNPPLEKWNAENRDFHIKRDGDWVTIQFPARLCVRVWQAISRLGLQGLAEIQGKTALMKNAPPLRMSEPEAARLTTLGTGLLVMATEIEMEAESVQ